MGDLRAVICVFAALLIGTALATEPFYPEPCPTCPNASMCLRGAGFFYNAEQSTKGTGIANSNQMVEIGPMSLDIMRHGSGDYEYESLYSADRRYDLVQVKDNTIQKYNPSICPDVNPATEEVTGTIDLTNKKNRTWTLGDQRFDMSESASMIDIPGNISVGRSFKAMPKSLWRDSTSLKHHGIGLSTGAVFDQTHALKKDAEVKMWWNPGGDGGDNFYSQLYYVKAYAKMKLEAESVGRANLDASMTELTPRRDMTEPMTEPTKRDIVLFDEDYVGTFHITRKLNIQVNRSVNNESDDWLPCCTGGWSSMNPRDKQGHSAESIFDCTCYQPLGDVQDGQEPGKK